MSFKSKSNCNARIFLYSSLVVLQKWLRCRNRTLLSFKSDCDEGIFLYFSLVVLQKWLRWRNLSLLIICCPSKVTAMQESYLTHHLLSFKSDCHAGIVLCCPSKVTAMQESYFVVLQKWLRWRNLFVLLTCCP